LDFLAELFDQGLEYRTIGVIRSSISAYHETVDGQNIGDHPLVRKLMSGVDVQRPPQPRYPIIWDVEVVLNHLRVLPEEDKLSLSMLSHKTAMLLALATVSRASELQLLDLAYMTQTELKIMFYFKEPLKHCRKAGKCPAPLEVEVSGMPLCPVKSVRSYIERTASLRGTETQLFVGTIKPHKPVSRPTIANWIKTVLKEVGIDTEIFKGHSTRSASTSGASAKGASIKDILERGQWSNASCWQRFYNKNIATANSRFQEALFKLGSN
jgi:hypothetical protein